MLAVAGCRVESHPADSATTAAVLPQTQSNNQPPLPTAATLSTTNLPAAGAVNGGLPPIREIGPLTSQRPPEPVATGSTTTTATTTATASTSGPACTRFAVPGAYFGIGEYTLLAEALSRIAELIPKLAGMDLEIHGHTDSIPIAMGNQLLSELRAQAVAEALITAGIDPEHIVAIVGHGANQPADPSGTPQADAANRRVEIVVCATVGHGN